MTDQLPPPFQANLVGANFRPQECRDICATLEVGQGLSLERDPFNAYDENAIKVMFTDLSGSYHIGFVESRSGIAKQLAPYLDDGWVYECRIKTDLGDKRTPFLLEITPTGERNEPDAGAAIDEDYPS